MRAAVADAGVPVQPSAAPDDRRPNRPRRAFTDADVAPSPLRPRTFARLSAFDLACPSCGAVDSIQSGRPWWKRKSNFDPWRSRWKCRSCRRVFAIGLAIWPVRRAGNRPQEDRPIDTIPTTAEVLELRGLVQQETRGWAEPVNRLAPELGDDNGHDPIVDGESRCP